MLATGYCVAHDLDSAERRRIARAKGWTEQLERGQGWQSVACPARSGGVTTRAGPGRGTCGPVGAAGRAGDGSLARALIVAIGAGEFEERLRSLEQPAQHAQVIQ